MRNEKRKARLFYFLSKPDISEIRNRTMKIKNNTLAMEAAPAAIPPNPKIAAMMATMKKISAQRNIIIQFW
jgi:hypothetical protein